MAFGHMKLTKKTTTRKGGRPSFKPTAEQRELVKQLAGLGTRHEDVCLFIKRADGKPICRVTLTKYFAEELSTGKAEANAKVSNSLFKMATQDGNVAAAIFWLKTQAGWRETPAAVELTGKDGAPLHPVADAAVPVKDYKAAMREVLSEF